MNTKHKKPTLTKKTTPQTPCTAGTQAKDLSDMSFSADRGLFSGYRARHHHHRAYAAAYHSGVQHQSHSLRCCHVGKPSCWSVYASLWLQPLRGCGRSQNQDGEHAQMGRTIFLVSCVLLLILSFVPALSLAFV